MAKTRVLSQSKAVYVTKVGVLAGDGINASGVQATQLHRINDLSFEVDIAGSREDIREFGQLARIGTIINDDLAPSMTMTYLLTDGENESHLGMEIKNSITGNFVGGVQGISGYLTENPDFNERNIFVVTVPEGYDAHSADSWVDRTLHNVVGLGNAFLTEYTVDLAVGETPSASVTFEGSNLAFYTGTSSGLYNPSLSASTAARYDSGQVALPISSTGNSNVEILRPRQIQLDLQAGTKLGVGGTDLATLHPQSVTLSVPLAREPLSELGASRPYARPLTVPIDVTLSVSAIASDYVDGEIAGLLTGCGGQEKRNINVKLFDSCNPTLLRLGYQLKNAVLDSQSNSQDIDGNETVELQFSAQIGGATTIKDGFFMTGSYALANGSPLTPTYVSGLVG